MAWTVLLEKPAIKTLLRAPSDIEKKFQFWMNIVVVSGPQGLRAVKGFHDEALSGEMKGLRSSRLSLHWRVIYRVEASIVTVTVTKITAHVNRL